MKVNELLMDEKDNVVTCVEPISAGQDCRAGQPTPGNKAYGFSDIAVDHVCRFV